MDGKKYEGYSAFEILRKIKDQGIFTREYTPAEYIEFLREQLQKFGDVELTERNPFQLAEQILDLMIKYNIVEEVN